MKNRIFLIPLALSLLFMTGCFSVNGNFKQIRNYLLNNVEGAFEKDTEFAMGPATLALAGFAASFSEENNGELASEMLDNISKVQIGVYNVRKLNASKIDFSLVKNISERMEAKGWRYIIRSVENGEMTAVFVPSDLKDGVKKLFVFTLNNKEIVLVEISGDLDEVVEIAVRDRGFNSEFQ